MGGRHYGKSGPGTLNGARYRQFIANELQSFLGNIPPQQRQGIIFMQDGASPHNARATLTALRMIFPGGVLATDGDYRWPARSPDLTPLDFFLWGRVKNLVYSAQNLPYANVAELQSKVEEVLNNIDHSEIRRATRSVSRRCLCLDNAGAQFEHLL